jgi:ATP-dependent helicase/nuclease subunit A
MSRTDASRYLDASRGLCAIKIGGWAPHELHEHENEEVLRDEAEGVRLAYVAATRARDLLVVPALGDSPWEGGWLSPLNAALYPSADARRNAVRGPRCPAFKSKDTVVERPNDEPATATTMCPGAHVFDEGYSVVWWDPGALELGAKPPLGVRREELIVKDVARDVVADGRLKYDTWKLARSNARDQGSVPTMRVKTVREFVAEEIKATNEAIEAPRTQSVQRPEVSVISVPLRLRDPERPSGALFGTLVHAVLARAPFAAAPAELQDIALLEARLLAMSEDDAASAAAIAGSVMEHELLVRARRADARGACRRETPVTLTLDDGTLVEGVVDLAFEENGAWTVVDYKTDREIATDGEEQYRRQLAAYALAIARSTGAPASGILVRV